VIEQRSSAGTYLQYSPMLKFLWRGADLVVNCELVVAKPSAEPFLANNTLYHQAVVVKLHDQFQIYASVRRR
jgi:hypothetical protein